MDMKYDKMIAVNKAESEQKIKKAIRAIDDMGARGLPISVTELVRWTGLSRGFFYKNMQVRQRLEEAVKLPRRIDVQQPSEETNVVGYNFQELKKDFNSCQSENQSKYPKIYKSWSERWATLATYFKYPEQVRKLLYTTNAIEGFNRQLRKVTKSKTVFPTDDSLLKMLYLATMDITKKWTGRRRDWSQIRAQLDIFFEERLEKYMY